MVIKKILGKIKYLYSILKRFSIQCKLLQYPKFIAFKPIKRFSRDCIITEKIDGTNAQIYITKRGRVYAGSRNKWLIPGKNTDNYGFAKWVKDNEETLKLLGPGRHYGEWFGKGINRGYGLENRKFYLFNVDFWKKLDESAKIQLSLINVGCVPVILTGLMSTTNIDSALDTLRHFGSFVTHYYMNPEGIVIYHIPSGYMFKKTLENDDKPKGAK